jgi:hypothetical protein
MPASPSDLLVARPTGYDHAGAQFFFCPRDHAHDRRDRDVRRGPPIQIAMLRAPTRV